MSGLALEEYELLEDPKYRTYVANVDKALRNFESTSEWADLISTLGKLSKVLLSHMKYPVVPRRIIISKRLAQCLHPALPSGVHLKALEIYDVIFKCMGTNRLSQELFIYSAGLFPLFSSAAMNVRSALLTIYENHFVPLGSRLRPGLNGFLAGTLSGLEESSDHIERTSLLLQRVAEGVGQAEFFGCLWECILANANVRLPAINHITWCFNKKLSTEDQLFILGTNIDIMVSGLCQALEDQAVLVQRAALDLTLLLLPMHNTQLLRSDLTSVVASSLIVLLRRDMSVNRRLFAWLLGSEVNISILTSEHPIVRKLGSTSENLEEEKESYFQGFSESLLIDAFITTLKVATKSNELMDLRPFKIIIPLLDKPEIGPFILDKVFLDLLRCVFHMSKCQQQSNERSSRGSVESDSHSSYILRAKSKGYRSGVELTKSALLVFSSLQPSYPWWQLLALLKDCCYQAKKFRTQDKGKNTESLPNVEAEKVGFVNEVGYPSVTVAEICKLLEFLMEILPLDTQQHIEAARLPEVLSLVTVLFKDYIEVLLSYEIVAGLEFCKHLLERLLPSVAHSYSIGTQSGSKVVPLNLGAYSGTFEFRPPGSWEFPSSLEVPNSAECGIIQIGIEAEKVLNERFSQFSQTDENLDNVEESEENSEAGANVDGFDEPNIAENSTCDPASLKPSEEENVILKSIDLEVNCKSTSNEPPVGNESFYTMSTTSTEYQTDSFEAELSSSFQSTTLKVPDSTPDSQNTNPFSSDVLESTFIFKYIKEFKDLFLSLVEKLLMSPESQTLIDLERVLFSQVSRAKERNLSSLMKECVHDERSEFTSQPAFPLSASEQFLDRHYNELASSIIIQPYSINYLPVFKVACAILVELSSMPAAVTLPCSPTSLHSSKQHLPLWLLSLLACIFSGNVVSPLFTQVAISTLLELLALAKSDLSAWRREKQAVGEEEGLGVVTLRMFPLLIPSHVHCLIHNTYLFQFMTHELWRHLDTSTPQHHLVSSELLLQLHGLSLSPNRDSAYILQELSIVEREVLKFFTSQKGRAVPTGNMQSIRWSQHIIDSECDNSTIFRWMTLWNVSRGLTKSISQSYPYLNKSLFLMIERLQSPSVLERSCSQRWLAESLNYGDLGRILDPVFELILQRNTRRVSVQHINIKRITSKSNEEECVTEMPTDSHVYAISSVGGEVMYHIGRGPTSRLKKEQEQIDVFKKQIFAFTSVVASEKNKCVTKQIELLNYETPALSQGGFHSMSLLINPFSQHPWIDMDDLAKMSKSTDLSKVTNAVRPKEPKFTATDIATAILDEIIEKAISQGSSVDEEMQTDSRSSTASPERIDNSDITLHPLHSHLLLYMELIDAGQCLYGLHLIRNVLDAQTKLFLLSLSSTSINSQKTVSPLLLQLAKHRRSVFGQGFDGEITSETVGQFRSTMYLQVVITVSLYFIRSYYPQQLYLHVQEEHLCDNRELQVVAAELLQSVFSQMILLVVDSPRGFSPYVKDLLNKCKVQKCVLHCLLSIVNILKGGGTSEDTSEEVRTLTQDILEYNLGLQSDSEDFPQDLTFVHCLIDLTLALIKLEDAVFPNRNDPLSRDSLGSINSKTFSLSSLRYIYGQPIPSQPMFLWSVILVLSQKNLRHFHSSWLNFFTASLPHMGVALPLNSLRIMTICCSLLEELSVGYNKEDTLQSSAPADYTLHLLSGLMNIVHFCLLDAAQASIGSSSTASASTPSSSVNQTAGQIFYNLLHVFSPSGEILDASLDTTMVDPISCARKTILSHLPRLMSSLLMLWMSTQEHSGESAFIIGNRQSVRQHIVELLSPVCHHHTSHLLAAVSVVWQGVYEEPHSEQRGIKPYWSPTRPYSLYQLSLVEMLAALKVLPLHSLVENVKQVFMSPPIIEGATQKVPLEVSILEMFYLYVKETATVNQLALCLSHLLVLVKEGISCLPPPALLVLLASLNEFIQKSPPLQEKREIRELQDVAAKLLDAVSTVAGSKLESTNWLRRNLTVKAESPSDAPQECSLVASSYSVAALSVLAELLAPMLDVLYSSEEKERVTPLLTNIMANVIPYLKNHQLSNMPAFHACSQLLSSLSSYQYTLKAWRKEVLELLLDNSTFKMMPETLPYWRTLVDNLFTQDKSIFKELLGKISVSQGGSLNLFASREAEYETRAGLLKRLAFTIFCSETDQYLRLIPDVQERLTEVTRLGQVIPSLVGQVFLCFRVLLLRISPRGTTSLWPIVITELVQVLLLIEQELSTDTEQFSGNRKSNSYHLKRLSTLDSKWVTGSHNGLQARNNPAWLALYLAASKLLDFMVALPAYQLPQFQMYRWAFVGPENAAPGQDKNTPVGGILLQHCDFVPHVVRITKLMNQNRAKMKVTPLKVPTYPYTKGRPLLTSIATISTLMDLHPFFATLISSEVSKSGLRPHMDSDFVHIETMIERDFLEPATGAP